MAGEPKYLLIPNLFSITYNTQTMIIGDSKCISISEDLLSDYENYFNGWSEIYAREAVILALKQEGDERAQSISFSGYACTQLNSERCFSEVCYLESDEVGYFFIMRDMVDHINVIYNRWD